MTGPSGNRLSICPLRFRIASLRVSIEIDSLLPSRPVIICLLDTDLCIEYLSIVLSMTMIHGG